MSAIITLELPENVAQYARTVAELSHKRVEDLLVELLDQAVHDAIDNLPDEQILALANLQMSAHDQAELSDLLAKQRESELTDPLRLDELMGIYRRGLIQKARAAKIAVERGLIPSLGEN